MWGRLLAELELGVGTAEFDGLDLVRAVLVLGIDGGVFELLAAAWTFTGAVNDFPVSTLVNTAFDPCTFSEYSPALSCTTPALAGAERTMS